MKGNVQHMDNTWVGFLIVVLTILASHSKLHRYFARLVVELKECMAKLEGAFEVFMNRGKTQ